MKQNKWTNILPAEVIDVASNLERHISMCRATEEIFPAQDDIFNALELTEPDIVKVVIIGQDPYHAPNQAHGLCFSVKDGVNPPPSLVNIMNEIETDIGVKRTSTDLTSLAQQGVLLLNTTLTVRRGAANSHRSFGWNVFTKAVLQACLELPQPIVFLCWGADALNALKECDDSKAYNKYALTATHPSPLSAGRKNAQTASFIGCKHFSKANNILEKCGVEPIDWSR